MSVNEQGYQKGTSGPSTLYIGDKLSINISQLSPSKNGEPYEDVLGNGKSTIELSTATSSSSFVKVTNSIAQSGSVINSSASSKSENAGIQSYQNSVGEQVLMIFKDGGNISNGLVLRNPLLTDVFHLQSNINSIYAVAQANLVAQTQEDIARQFLAQGAVNTSSTASVEVVEQKAETTYKRPENWVSKDSPPPEKEKKFMCKHEGCGRNFSSAGHLRNHEQCHQRDKPLTCDFEGCGRSFTYKAHLTYHKLTHTNDRKYKCKVKGCEMLFFTSQRLQVHMRVHTGDKPFWCQECGKGFTTAGNLKNHIRIHSGERPFVCKEDGCDKRFAEYSSLRKHMLTHTGEKPFKCEKCGRSFTQTSSRMQHMKRHLMNPDSDTQDVGGDKQEKVKRKEEGIGDKQEKVKRKYESVLLLRKNTKSTRSKDSPPPRKKDEVYSTIKDSSTKDHNYLPILNEMMLAEEVFPPSEDGDQEQPVSNCANVVVLSQPQISSNDLGFHPASNPEHEEIVYNTDYLHPDLHHEKVTEGIIEDSDPSNSQLDTGNVMSQNQDISCQNYPMSNQPSPSSNREERQYTDTLASTPQEYKLMDSLMESDGELDTLYKS